MRYAPEPGDAWLKIDPLFGGVTTAEPPAAAPSNPRAPRREEVKAEALAALPAKSMREVARKLGLREQDKTLTLAWRELREGGEIVQVAGAWQCSAVVPSLRGEGYCTASAGRTVVCDGCGAALTQTPQGLVCIGCFSRGDDTLSDRGAGA